MSQLPLPLRLPRSGGFDAFIAGTNAAALAAVRDWADGRGQRYLYLHGAAETGKTHLLTAAAQAMVEQGGTPVYLPLGGDALAPALLDDLELRDAVLVDGLQQIAGHAAWERALFDLYNRLEQAGRRLLAAASVPPRALGLGLADLTSRLGAGAAYGLDTLDDDGAARLLASAAAQRGLTLEPAAVSYILTRCHRSPSRLLDLLDALDRYSLAHHRKPTVPLIRELLDRREAEV